MASCPSNSKVSRQAPDTLMAQRPLDFGCNLCSLYPGKFISSAQVAASKRSNRVSNFSACCAFWLDRNQNGYTIPPHQIAAQAVV